MPVRPLLDRVLNHEDFRAPVAKARPSATSEEIADLRVNPLVPKEEPEATPSPLTERDLSPDQLVVYKAARKWIDDKGPGNLLTIGGFAGAGKSTITSVIAKQYEEKRIAFCALTGKAANVLRQKLQATGVRTAFGPVSTIHSLIYFPFVSKEGHVTGWGKRLDLDADLVVVDEASMLDKKLYTDLSSFGIPIIAVGDHGQLPPIYNDGFSLMLKPHLRLEHIHRQAAGNPILQLSAYIREHGSLPDKLPDDPRLYYADFESYEEKLNATYSKPLLPEELLQLGILCYKNDTRRMLNRAVREIRFGCAEDAPPKQGEQIICLRNTPTVFNGMRGNIMKEFPRTRASHTYQMDVLFPEEKIRVVGDVSKYQFDRPKTFSSFEEFAEFGFAPQSWREVGLLLDYGYCLTVHKSQGSSFEKAVVVFERPRNISADDYRRWAYTAVTRASKELVIIRE